MSVETATISQVMMEQEGSNLPTPVPSSKDSIVDEVGSPYTPSLYEGHFLLSRVHSMIPSSLLSPAGAGPCSRPIHIRSPVFTGNQSCPSLRSSYQSIPSPHMKFNPKSPEYSEVRDATITTESPRACDLLGQCE
eukprot:gene6681-2604_t